MFEKIKNKLRTETEHANDFHSCKTFYLNAFMLIYSFDNDDMRSSKHHVILLSLIFLLKFLFLHCIFIGYISGQATRLVDCVESLHNKERLH